MELNSTELCFWMFLINAGPQQPDWFNSKYFRIWVSGSVVALIMMPLVSTLTRHNPFTVSSSLLFAHFHSFLVMFVPWISFTIFCFCQISTEQVSTSRRDPLDCLLAKLRPVTSWKGRVEISSPAAATPMIVHTPQPL